MVNLNLQCKQYSSYIKFSMPDGCVRPLIVTTSYTTIATITTTISRFNWSPPQTRQSSLLPPQLSLRSQPTHSQKPMPQTDSPLSLLTIWPNPLFNSSRTKRANEPRIYVPGFILQLKHVSTSKEKKSGSIKPKQRTRKWTSHGVTESRQVQFQILP